ncbi:MAG TPA: glutaredoxin family protein [Ramlibacter sp.]|nr:glutaredoxin family protein [Ramlibacter sp.]
MSSVRLAALAALVGCAALAGATASAQVFRVVGPDGKVTFTDRPPSDARATPAPTVALPGGGGGASASLPMELRSVAGRFPVTLYTSADCTPCGAARGYLVTRGIPFSERTVTTQEDVRALQRLAGEARLPFATIGAQHLRGFSDAEWGQYLDAAGYPQVSQLPSGWRNPDPAPLVAIQAPTPRPRPQQAQQPQQPQNAEAPRAPSDPTPSNPTGIRF